MLPKNSDLKTVYLIHTCLWNVINQNSLFESKKIIILSKYSPFSTHFFFFFADVNKAMWVRKNNINQ